MSSYKIVTGKNGDRYMKDSRFVSKASLPPEIYTQLKVGVTVTDEELNPVIDRACVFCGVYSNLSRLLNGQAVYICEEHYYSESIGKIAQRIRELHEEKHPKEIQQLQEQI